MWQGEDLLDTVYRTVKCTYLSDLREGPCLKAAIRYLSSVEPGDYPLWQWQDAVRYLTGGSLSFETPEVSSVKHTLFRIVCYAGRSAPFYRALPLAFLYINIFLRKGEKHVYRDSDRPSHP